MTKEHLLAFAVTIGPFALLLGYMLHLHWLENRRGGASEYHKREIRELSVMLGQEPPANLDDMSWIQALKEAIWLERRLRLQQQSNEIRRQMGDKNYA